ncbi:PRD domain-containing protein [Raineyella sp.]|uniref:PRD domain-containing protein n=1 Tax=Raineyella sp. TaxID=1911550 RepID=UPI002B1F5428|nr:PRD domain-containing protein [Raineyella sp.]
MEMEGEQIGMVLVRALNNNAVLAERDGQEVVAMGPGIGFGTKHGNVLPPDKVERIFFQSPTQPIERLTALLAGIPAEHLDVAIEMCEEASARLSIPLPQSLILAVADHLRFAVQRHADGVKIEYPLSWEVANLYPDHLMMGRRALDMVADRLGVRLPEEEAVSFALHMVVADAEGDPHDSPGMRQLTLLGQVFDLVDSSFSVTVDRESMSAARFVTHMRYLFARMSSDRQLANTPSNVLNSIADSYSDATVCAHRIAYLVEMWGDATVTPDEISFLALHVARLVQDLEGGPPPPGKR